MDDSESDVESVVKKDVQEWITDPLFPEVPADKIKQASWVRLGMGAWRDRHEDIYLGELRAMVYLVRFLFENCGLRNYRVLVLGDNMSVVLASARDRSKIFKGIVLLRRLAAYKLVYNIVAAASADNQRRSRQFRGGDSHALGLQKPEHEAYVVATLSMRRVSSAWKALRMSQ